MGDLGDYWRDVKEARKEAKDKRDPILMGQAQIKIEGTGNTIQALNMYHWRIRNFDFWPTTGTWLNRITAKKGRGLNKLIKELMQSE